MSRPDSAMPTTFAARLADRVTHAGTPLCVGIDPRWDMLPEALRTADAGAGFFAEQAADIGTFCRELIDAVAPLVGVVKPQSAFFEQWGPAGMVELARVVEHARAAGLFVILDVKRGDIGSTAAAYAEGLLGADSPWGADAITVNPYLGGDSLDPFVEVATQRDAGVFVLVKTSNPGGGQFQDLSTAAPDSGGRERAASRLNGLLLYERVAAHVEELAATTAGGEAYGAVGAVVGATYPQQLTELRQAMPHAWLLVPGLGSQGGAAEDVKAAFDTSGLGAIINSSRAINFAYRREPYLSRYGEARWQEAVAAATEDTIEELKEGVGSLFRSGRQLH